MYTSQPKKLLIINILDILRRHTDEEHRLSQREIKDLLASEYQMEVDRKSIKRNLCNLMDFGYDLSYTEVERTTPGGRKETLMTDWYINREFDDSELRLLVDSILFSHQIPSRQRKELIAKLEGLSNRYFKSRVGHVKSVPEVTAINNQLFYSISMLDEAINKKKQVRFEYGNCNSKGKLKARTNDDGLPRRYQVSPYQMVAANGRYYLICNRKGDSLNSFRVDRIINIELAEELARPLRSLVGYAGGLDLPKHMAEHLYMFAGSPVRVRFKVCQEALNHVFDWFGSGATVKETDEESAEVVVSVNEQAMRYWALQFNEHIEILEPASLKEALRADGQKLAKKYG
ncbi:MAG: WYL domain-containing protein [Coriobacteriia bacterium]|nr:WYL domain-containing protein [Coriobacteriia bacterium]